MKTRAIALISYVLMSIMLFGMPFLGGNIPKARAGNITDVTVTATNYTSLASGVSITVGFSLATTQKMQKVIFYFGKTDVDRTAPANLAFTQGSVINHNLGANWTVSDPGSTITLTNIQTSPNITELTSSTAVSMTVTDVTNPELDDCSITGEYKDKCYVHVETYAYIPEQGEDPAQENALIDTGVGSYELTDTPFFTYSIEGVASGQTHNNITTSKASTFDKLDFGTLEYETPRYMAQKLFIKTNSPNGYDVKVRLKDGMMQGLYPANNIDPFMPSGASWGEPKTWATPSGTTGNEDTGWIGANTTDTRVPGWIGAEGKFGPMASSWRSVALQEIRNRGDKSVYVTYAIEINYDQPSDIYAGTIEYLVMPKY